MPVDALNVSNMADESTTAIGAIVTITGSEEAISSLEANNLALCANRAYSDCVAAMNGVLAGKVDASLLALANAAADAQRVATVV